ncbi:MAG: DUF6318 family protein [Geodermatophilaceae bacterium]
MTVRVGAAAAAVVLALLAGCSESDPPPTTSLPTTTASMPPTTSTATTTSAPTTEAGGVPPVPAAAQTRIPDGAASFVRYWFEVLRYSQAQLDSSALRALDDGTCLSCDNFADTIDLVAEDGNELRGGEATLGDVQAAGIANDGSTTVNTTAAFAKQVIVTPEGSEELLGEQAEAQLVFGLVWTNGAWLVTEVQIL